MKKQILTIATSLLFFILAANAQEYSPTKVVRPTYYDKTPPLKEMKLIEPGIRDRSWKDNIVENKSIEEKHLNQKGFETESSSLQEYFGPEGTKGPVLNFDGTHNVNGVYPPDTDGDVGPNHYVQMINLSFAIWDKDGNKLYGPADNSTLWDGFIGPWTGTNDGDPIIIYDDMADRWLASQFAVNTSNGTYWELLAVSATPDPLGQWYRYAFQFSQFPDYPKIGVWNDSYIATFNMFAGSFAGVGVAAFDRDAMLNGDPNAQMVYFGPYGSKFGMMPADIDGDAAPADSPALVATVNIFGNHNMEIWRAEIDWNNPNSSTFTIDAILNPDSFNSNIDGIPQPNTGMQLDAIASMLMYRLQYRNFGSYETMVTNHTVNVSGRAGVRWYEIRRTNDTWEIYQQGTYAPDNEYRWMGSIAMAENGNIALGYTVSSSNTYPSIRVTGRTPDAPLGEMNYDEVEIIAGQSSQTNISRWGDYSCMTVDPTNDSTFWYTQEYRRSSGWGTRIASFNLGPVQAPTAFAGPDAIICENVIFDTQGNATNNQSVEWTTSGDGIFDNPNSLTASYLRGNNDLANGEVTLTLTAYGYNSGEQVSDDMLLTINLEPVAMAGNDTTINTNSTITLNGSAEHYTDAYWLTAGDGTFDDNTSLNAVYTPGNNDISNGEVVLTLNATPLPPCEEEDMDAMTLTLDPFVGIEENLRNVQVEILPNPNNGNFQLFFDPDLERIDQIHIYDLTGHKVFSQNVPHNQEKLTFSLEQPRGLYFMSLQNSSGTITKKLIIK